MIILSLPFLLFVTPCAQIQINIILLCVPRIVRLQKMNDIAAIFERTFGKLALWFPKMAKLDLLALLAAANKFTRSLSLAVWVVQNV